MDYQVENRVRLNTESPHDSLYKWFLEEFDPKGKKIGPDYIPWAWSLFFDVRNLTVRKSFELSGDKPGTIVDTITGTLTPDRSGRRGDVEYSFFGTDRTVKSFSLRILKSDDGNEHRQVMGSIAYESDFDFSNELEPDFVEVVALLPAAKFDDLAKFAEDGRSKAVVMLKLVHGFYSNWSPSIRTNHVKILSNPHDQKVEIEKGSGVQSPTLGEVGDFAIHFHKGSKASAVSENVPSPVPDTEEPDDSAAPAQLAAVLTRIEAKVSKLSIPLWIAAGALIASLFVR